jgi:hypothetical protein
MKHLQKFESFNTNDHVNVENVKKCVEVLRKIESGEAENSTLRLKLKAGSKISEIELSNFDPVQMNKVFATLEVAGDFRDLKPLKGMEILLVFNLKPSHLSSEFKMNVKVVFGSVNLIYDILDMSLLDEDVMEEVNWKKAIVGGALAASLATGSGCHLEIPEVDSIETVERKGRQYQRFSLLTKDLENIDVIVSKNGVVTATWKVNEDESTSTYQTISVPKGATKVYYDEKFFGGLFADITPISDDYLDMIDYKVTHRQDGLAIKDSRKLFGFNDVAEYNGYMDNSCKFTVGTKDFTYYIDDSGSTKMYYIIPSGSKFGGAGSGSKW